MQKKIQSILTMKPFEILISLKEDQPIRVNARIADCTDAYYYQIMRIFVDNRIITMIDRDLRSFNPVLTKKGKKVKKLCDQVSVLLSA